MQILSKMLPGGPAGLVVTVFLSLLFVVLVRVAWRVDSVRRAVMFVILLAPACVLAILGVFATVLWWPISLLTDLLVRFVPLDRLVGLILLVPARFSRVPLIRGERRRVAERMWSPARFPDLYLSTPADIARPVYEDGRLLGGGAITWLSDRHLTDNALRSAIRAGLKAGLLTFLLILVIQALNATWNILTVFGSLFSDNRPVLESWPGDAPIKVSAWDGFAANIGPASLHLLENLGVLIFYVPTGALIAAGVAVFIFLFFLHSWLRQKAGPYEIVTKDADVRWPYRIESRNILHETFRRQHKQATVFLKGKPTYLIGIATGTLRLRGDITAPMPGQAVKLDQESLFQHLIVFGGTGEGKTSGILKPLMKQVLVRQVDGSKFGAFVTDAKGVLWRDAMRVAERLGRSEDVVTIGTGENDVGVNIVAGLTPAQIAATLRAVLAQLGTGGKDSFWPDMASSVFRHMLTIGMAYANTEAGVQLKKTGLNTYSLWWPYQAILRPELSEEAIKHILAKDQENTDQIRTARNRQELETRSRAQTNFMTDELSDSIAYIATAWRDMAKETKTGIIANVTQLLDGFASSSVLRQRFASGIDANTITLRQALDGKLVLNTLSSIEDGLPARLVSILIKTALYREARLREAEFRATGEKPQDRPCLVVMDEVQELATVDPSSGLSDASFWNVARSTGLAGVFATQTVSALTQAMGDHAAHNFMQQARSKVFFRTEEQATVEYACWCAGEYERNRVFDDGHRESIESRAAIDGWDPLAPVDEEEEIPADASIFFEAAKNILSSEGQFGAAIARPTYDVDLRFIAEDATPDPKSGATAGNAARMGSLQAAYWRAEDLTRQFRQEGNELAPALTPADMIHMGRWHAFSHIQRAGSMRQDIVVIQHDHDES